MNDRKILITPYISKYAEQTVKMWRDSKEQAIGQNKMHSMDDHIYFLNHILPQDFQIELALLEEKVVGMIAFNASEINQLYIHKEFQGIGIGQRLLDIAKKQSSGRLKLHTFEVNKNAQQFYEKNGFKVFGRGHENEENLPDIQYKWNRSESV